MVRSILAVFAGMVLWSVLWLGGNAIVRAALPEAFDAQGMTARGGVLSLIVVLSVVFSIVSGYLTGVLARRREVLHAFVFGVLQLAIGIGVQASVWDQMPLWYHLSFLVMLVPASVFGGYLRSLGGAAVPRGGAMARA